MGHRQEYNLKHHVENLSPNLKIPSVLPLRSVDMKPEEAFKHFDETKYIERIANRHFSYTTLAREIYKKRTSRLSSKVKLGMSIVAIPFTGVAVVGTALSGRNIHVESHKLELLELEWARRGQTRLPERSWREKVVPISITVGACAFMIGIDVGLSHLMPSPDVFYQQFPPTDLEGFLISEFVPKAVENAVSQVAEFATDEIGETMEEGALCCYFLTPISGSLR